MCSLTIKRLLVFSRLQHFYKTLHHCLNRTLLVVLLGMSKLHMMARQGILDVLDSVQKLLQIFSLLVKSQIFITFHGFRMLTLLT